MSKYNLPKSYLSYSAYSLWKSNKDGYRKKYYENIASIETPQTRFGKEQHAKMEESPEVRGSETRIECKIDDDLKLMGYVDSLDPDTLKIIDFKFSHLSKTGKEPWDDIKVRKHEQFPYYCLIVRCMFDRYNPEVELHWHETKFKEHTVVVYQGRKYKMTTKNMETTGRVTKFIRNVEEWEVDRMKEEIIKVATEISNDYTLWQSTNNK